MRSAEQRCPAEPKAEVITSSITCSRSAVVSTNMALRPPVSAMKGNDRRRRGLASASSMARAVSVPPVKATPSMPGWAISAAPTVSPRPGSKRAAGARSSPAAWQRRTAAAAISGVCSAGLATTALPAASAAAIWPSEDGEREVPRADAGEDAAAMPAPASWSRRPGPCSVTRSGEVAARPAARNSGRNRPPRALRRSRRPGSCRASRGQDGDQPLAVGSRCASATRVRIWAARAAAGGVPAGLRRRAAANAASMSLPRPRAPADHMAVASASARARRGRRACARSQALASTPATAAAGRARSAAWLRSVPAEFFRAGRRGRPASGSL